MTLKDKLWKIPFVAQSHLPFRFLPDRFYLSCTFRGLMKQTLNWNNPETFNEKMQVLKLRMTDPEYAEWVDKNTAKKKAAQVIGSQYLIPTLGYYGSLEEFEAARPNLPEKYVLKTTHNSGGVWVIDPEHPVDDRTREQVRKNLNQNYYNQWREFPYKNVKPALIAETFMGRDLKDYKIFCFHGKPEIILVCSERSTELKEDFFDTGWQHLDMKREKHPNADTVPEKPEHLEQMLEISKKLSAPFEFVRVDLFEIDGEIYFGELTFSPACGFEGFVPDDWDKKMGSWIRLSKN